MGSPLSPILTDLIIQNLERNIFNTLATYISIYYRYVDDIVIAALNDHINAILYTFNSYHERIKFTVDYGENRGNHFLDVKLLIEDWRVIFANYKKSTNSGRYLNFFSNHPVEHKRGVIIALLDRILFLSHPKFNENNIIALIIKLYNRTDILHNFYSQQLITG